MPVRFVSLLGVCLLACSLTAQAAEKRLDRTFTVSPGGRLTIESDGSDLRVEGTSGNQVEVHILVKGSDRVLERMELTAEQSGADVSVTAKRNTRRRMEMAHGVSGQESGIRGVQGLVTKRTARAFPDTPTL